MILCRYVIGRIFFLPNGWYVPEIGIVVNEHGISGTPSIGVGGTGGVEWEIDDEINDEDDDDDADIF